LLAFVLSGAVAGLGGALFAFAYQQFNGNDFSFPLALTFLLMTVVGGAGSRWGVVVGAVLFALLHSALVAFPVFKAFAGIFGEPLHNNILQFGADLIAAVLLIFTVVRHPGGLSHSVDHFVKWLRGPIFARPVAVASEDA